MTLSMSRSFKNTLFAMIATFSLTSVSGLANAAETYTAGKDYRVLASQGPLDKPNQIEVREFFWYGCPHCYRLDPFVTQWLKTKPADVNFVRTPAAMNPVWEQSARGFYAIDMLGKTEQIHAALFSAIHKNPLQPRYIFSQSDQASFYAGQGIDIAKFNGLFNSFAVTGKIAQSKKLAMQYQLEGVPALVVNGKYVVSGEDEKAVKIVSFLVDKERKAGAVKTVVKK